MDPGQMPDMSVEDQNKMMGMIEEMQMRDSLKLYNRLVERCFTHCVDSFRQKTLDRNEEDCIRKCSKKFLNHTGRTTVRFAELNSMTQEQLLSQANQPKPRRGLF